MRARASACDWGGRLWRVLTIELSTVRDLSTSMLLPQTRVNCSIMGYFWCRIGHNLILSKLRDYFCFDGCNWGYEDILVLNALKTKCPEIILAPRPAVRKDEIINLALPLLIFQLLRGIFPWCSTRTAAPLKLSRISMHYVSLSSYCNPTSNIVARPPTFFWDTLLHEPVKQTSQWKVSHRLEAV
jgi:hypothetical protein